MSFDCCTTLGILESLYGMQGSSQHPGSTAICTKFIVKLSKRGGSASIRLVSSLAKYVLRLGIKEVYIDCIPPLKHYYKAMGFEVTGERFFHLENGTSIPMKLDLVLHYNQYRKNLGSGYMLRIYLKAKYFKLIDRLHDRNMKFVSTVNTGKST